MSVPATFGRCRIKPYSRSRRLCCAPPRPGVSASLRPWRPRSAHAGPQPSTGPSDQSGYPAAHAGASIQPSSSASIVQLAATASRAALPGRRCAMATPPLTRQPLTRDWRRRGRWQRSRIPRPLLFPASFNGLSDSRSKFGVIIRPIPSHVPCRQLTTARMPPVLGRGRG